MVLSGYSFVAVEVKVRKYNKTLNVMSLGKPVSFVFPRVLMFPETKSRETSGLDPSGSDIKCIMKVLPKRFHLHGRTKGFCPQT